MKILLFLIFFLTVIPPIVAQSLTVSPGWSVTIPASTITEAGLNYTTNVTSSTSQSLMNVNGSIVSTPKIYVQKTDVSWNSNLTLWIKRNTGGSGGFFASITNGTNFQQITNSPLYFYEVFTGLGTSVNNIPIQYEIRGLSVLIPAQSYTTTLLFTVTN
jgi:hypothetical protein